MGRGQLTSQVQAIAKRRLGRLITTIELRLMPYVMDCLMNRRDIDHNKINGAERKVLQTWRDETWLRGGAATNSLEVSSSFYDSMSEILKEGYCADYIFECTDERPAVDDGTSQVDNMKDGAGMIVGVLEEEKEAGADPEGIDAAIMGVSVLLKIAVDEVERLEGEVACLRAKR